MRYQFEQFELDVDGYELRRRGEAVSIGSRAFDLIAYLIRHRDRVVSKQQMLESLRRRFGHIRELSENGTAPADRYSLSDGTVFGIIASTTDPFCRTCDRSRLTADGVWFLCLYAADGLDLRSPLRRGASTAQIEELIAGKWVGRSARGVALRVPAVAGDLVLDPRALLGIRFLGAKRPTLAAARFESALAQDKEEGDILFLASPKGIVPFTVAVEEVRPDKVSFH